MPDQSTDEDVRAGEAAQLRDELLNHIRATARYWATLPDFDPATGRTKTILDRCEGVAFSILSTLDGASMVLPAFDLVARCAPEDNDARDGLVISDTLHEHFYRPPALALSEQGDRGDG